MRETIKACAAGSAALNVSHGLFHHLESSRPSGAKASKRENIWEREGGKVWALAVAASNAAPSVALGTAVLSGTSLWFGLGPWRLPLFGAAGLAIAAVFSAIQSSSSEQNSKKPKNADDNEKATLRLK